MKKFIAAAILFASAGTALASPFSDFSARVSEIRQAKHLPVERTDAFPAEEYQESRQKGKLPGRLP